MALRVPSRDNTKLAKVVERIAGDVELSTLWRCANINAIDRSGISDHGPVHIQIVANIALRLLRLLVEAEVKPSIVTNYGMTSEDAEVVVVLAAALHDLGMVVHRENHEQFSVCLAAPKLRELLDGIYDLEACTIITCEVLHAIYAHQSEIPCLTIEAGVAKVADALDMTKGRSRIPFEAGRVNIHSLSAASIEQVRLLKGQTKPIRVEIVMSNSAGIFQVDELLKHKLQTSTIAEYLEVAALMEGEAEKQLVKVFSL
ncbi:MAG: HD domain-containing protein [Bacteroidetes bacterium]|nr:HD domain-containing protein [Bacteroidota bacterium]MCL5025067.1 HD domain-containing protein [Chloroflexota bacterium]